MRRSASRNFNFHRPISRPLITLDNDCVTGINYGRSLLDFSAHRTVPKLGPPKRRTTTPSLPLSPFPFLLLSLSPRLGTANTSISLHCLLTHRLARSREISLPLLLLFLNLSPPPPFLWPGINKTFHTRSRFRSFISLTSLGGQPICGDVYAGHG